MSSGLLLDRPGVAISETRPSAAPSRAGVVEACGLSKRFGAVRAVDDLSFSVAAGTVTGFLGPNGAGKTTTLRMLLGLTAPTRGEAFLFGRHYSELEGAALRVGAVLEATDFHPGRSGRDHLRMLAGPVGLPDVRVDEVLRLVELETASHRRVKTYSLGMRQRLGLAAALLGDPELLVLDEPANGLDPEGVHWLRDFLREFASRGRTVLISSHILAEVQQTVDRVVIISHGRLVTEATLDELTARAGDSIRVRTTDVALLEDALRARGLASHRLNGDALVVENADPDLVGDTALAAGLPIHELVREASSLEDVFLQLTNGDSP